MFGLTLLLVILIIEISLLIYQRKTKQIEFKRKRQIRIGLFFLISVLTVFNVFSWGFRYYPLLFIYLILIVVNEVSFYKSNHKVKTRRPARLALKVTGLVLLFIFMFLPAFLFPKYELLETTGNYSVLTRTDSFIDFNRNEDFSKKDEYRFVNIRIWYPADTENLYPLLVYSHGGISLDTSNESLFLELASHGYVVVSVSHPYHSIVTKDDLGKNIWINQSYMNELNQENASEYPQESYEYYQKWMKLRTEDISFVIDQIKIKSENLEEENIYKLVDIDKIGLMGHSLGGSAALCLGRSRSDVLAVIALESPFMCDITSVSNQEFVFDQSPYPIPVLNIYSDSAYDYLSVWPQYKNNYMLLSSTDERVYNHHISGTYHFSLTDLSLTSPILARLLNGEASSSNSRDTLREINRVSLEYLNEYLK